VQPARYLELFLAESGEHLSTVNRLLLALESGERDGETVAGLFRAVHTLKGMAGAMGCPASADLAHALEHVLDGARGPDDLQAPETVELLFEATDALERAIRREALGDGPAEETGPLLERLHARGGVPAGRVRVRLTVRADAALPAVRAVLALRRARELGRVEACSPPEDRLMHGDFAGVLELLLATDRAPAEVRAELERVGELSAVEVRLEDGLVEGRAAAPSPVAPPTRGEATGGLVRVPQDRLDRLVDQVGELVIARDRVRALAAPLGCPALSDGVEELSRILGELRDGILGLRLVPVGEAFERFPRLVRDAARSLGKQVRFESAGHDVSLDRLLLNEVAELLVHLLRNAVDHGVEAPAERVAAGKPAEGLVRVEAVRERSGVTIRVEDDGRGIRRSRVLDAALAMGVPAPAGSDLLRLLVRAGLSTAGRVSAVSGRGVGLDVVATRVAALGGRLELETAEGEGTAFSVFLPLTLSIVAALQVRAGADVYAVPLGTIAEVTEIDASLPAGRDGAGAAEVRGVLVPLLDLASWTTGAADLPARSGPIPLVVVEADGARVGLVVDELRGRQEVVVKPFDPVRSALPVFAGATVLSEGVPSLVVDVARLVRWMDGAEPRPQPVTL
jgi:two-component system, chemotaxis family, sensor kinase CheA